MNSKITEEDKKNKKNTRILNIISVIEIIFAIMIIGIYSDYKGNAFTEYHIMSDDRDIVAHRAGSIFTPENTIVALDNAIEEEAQYAEIDVQQSKDGKIKLMIELKKNGHEHNIEEETVNLIKKYSFQEQCVIASMDLDILKKVKELDKNIKTVYITSVVYGNYCELENVDMFSIEATFVNKEVIARIHNENKKVFVWTVNEDESIKKVLSLPVDGIITDNPELAMYYQAVGSRDILILDLMRSVFPDYK